MAVAALAALASAEVIQRDKVRVSFNGELSPSRLPRQGLAPVRVSVSAKIVAVDGTTLPQLRRMEIAINRHGHFDPAGLPVCHIRDIQPTTTADALAACRDSLVGEGRFSAQVQVTEQAPFPSRGKVYAFNGRYQGTPAILAHVYGTQPAPTSYTVPFVIRPGHGDFGTVLEAALPDVVGSSGYVTGLSLNLGRSFTYRGATRSYLSAGCPAPPGFPGAPFRFARASFGFIGGRTLTSTLTRNCQVR
ncbi:MAG TPA: hypothetical protein VMS11_09865 [Solirubrobacterales bacterium]|nr:hypothetical protein [Solirubrobacterales bacterium]